MSALHRKRMEPYALAAPVPRPETWAASLTARDSERARDRLFLGPRRGGGGRRDPRNLVTGTITMLIIGVLLNIVGLGLFCWALFALATHALPFFVGMTVGIYSFQVGAGPFGAIVVGFVAGSTTLVAGQFAFSVARSPIVRLVVGLLFALPAACAGYDVTLAFAHIPSEWWRAAFAVVGAITVGGTAWARMSIVRNPASREVVLRRSHLNRPWEQPPRAGDSEAPSSVRLGSAR